MSGTQAWYRKVSNSASQASLIKFLYRPGTLPHTKDSTLPRYQSQTNISVGESGVN
jgi:hypothetical protein